MSKPKLALLEVGIFYLLAELIIWGSIWFRPPVLILAAIMVSLCIWSNRYHKDSQERIGLDQKHFWPALKFLLPIIVPLVVVLIFFGWGKEMRGGWNIWFAILGYPIWGFAQEYALLGFVANRLEDGLPKHQKWIPLISGILFSAAHLPNPVLTIVTFISGTLFTFVFFRHRNLLALALVHALFGILLSWVTSDVEALMTVGPGYLNRSMP